MSKVKELTCIVCPNSCRLRVAYDEKKIIEVIDGLCERGSEYAENEILHPVRSLTTTIKVRGGNIPLASVRSDKPIPKEKIFEAVKILRELVVDAPVQYHQILVNDILETGANIISTREIEKLIECS